MDGQQPFSPAGSTLLWSTRPAHGAPSLRAILEAVDLCELQSLISLQEAESWVVSVLHTKHNASGGRHEVKRCSAR
jgi:hypothetical protein